MCQEGVWKVYGRCLEHVQKVTEKSIEGDWKIPGKCLEDVWKVCEGIWKGF